MAIRKKPAQNKEPHLVVPPQREDTADGENPRPAPSAKPQRGGRKLGSSPKLGSSSKGGSVTVLKDAKSSKSKNPKEAREKALNSALEAIQTAFGQGAIMRMGEETKPLANSVPTGSLGLDIALGIGGLPRGRVVEIYGTEGSGKTSLTLHIIAEAQKAKAGKKAGGVCAFIDAEHALDPVYAAKLGVDIPALLIAQPDHGEQALTIVDTLVCSRAVDIVVIDSVAALTPRAELAGKMGDSHPGLQARLMSQALRKLTASIARSDTMVIFINQLRHKISSYPGNNEVTTGGNALKFYASVRIEIKRGPYVKVREEVIGSTIRVKIVKNKLAPPFRFVEFELIFGEGICKAGELIDLGIKAGVVEQSGSWFSYGTQRIGQGRDKVKTFLKSNPEIAAEIESMIRANSGLVSESLLNYEAAAESP